LQLKIAMQASLIQGKAEDAKTKNPAQGRVFLVLDCEL
tara:strand:- start:1679 stop:1792 length:114 start_codon:yes stop_codon:yes gene_type:complete